MDWLKKDNPLCIKTSAAVKLSKGLFYFTFVLYLILMTASDTSYRYESSSFLQILQYGMWICFALAILNIIFLCRYSIRQIFFILVFVIIYLVVWRWSEGTEYVFLQGMMIVFSCYYIDWERLLRFTFILYIPLILVPALLEIEGILPALETYRGGQQRLTFGFSHPNALGAYCLCFVILWLLIRFKKVKIWDYLAWLVIAAFVWFVPNSKTSTFLILAIFMLTFIFKHWGDQLLHSRFIRTLCSGVFMFMAGGSLLASYLFDQEDALFVTIDQAMFTNRISHAHSFLSEYPVTLFGQKLQLVGTVRAAMSGTQSYVLDNFYVHQLLSTGIVSFIIIIGLFTYVTYSVVKKRDISALIVLLIMAVCLVYENHGTELNYNFMLFLIAYQFIGSKDRKDISDGKSISNHPGV